MIADSTPFADFTEVQRLDTDSEVADHALITLADGRHSWYSGYHHGETFARRVRYASPDHPHPEGHRPDRLVLGNFCQFASGVSFLLGGNHGHDLTAVTSYGFDFFEGAANAWAPAGDTVIGHEVLIGYEALVMPGVRIGTGAVIGARAVITKDVPPYAVVVGDNRVVRHRFDSHTRKLLWRIAWWEWSDERIAEALPLLQGHDVRALARYAGVDPSRITADPDPGLLRPPSR
ncbi:chloramphenicol O-acetyltransferase type B [Streptomyces zhaozhouensis]|uniref:Chloramphenicol O-acetyltransferase type B n=1 Tax=Streptomyces zhaozhouensis TaxID=1300267 RepID=A0A286DXX9_9ACTN|nr:CatB-related O-acetyltransferase [Streptomyces zhaozhouensis]SOD63519.1 chloramphenicol O-acetyltransferase type B [Streptomyces zhaozhouensis]